MTVRWRARGGDEDVDESGENVPDLIDDDDDVDDWEDDDEGVSMYHRQRPVESEVDDFLNALRRQDRGRDSALAETDSADGEGGVVGNEVNTRHDGEDEDEEDDEEREQLQQREQEDDELEQSTIAAVNEKRYKSIEELPDTDYRRNPFVAPVLTDAQSAAVSEKLGLLTRKQVYPYEYVDSFERFAETELPARTAFGSKLNGEEISEEDYEHARKVWDVFNIKTMGEYHDLYLLSDVLLLADVFEAFCSMCLEKYGLDPTHSFTAPGFAWQAALKMSKVKLELLSDPDMHLFVEGAIRGGVSTISHRLAQANVPGADGYDERKPPTRLIYLDANNLYGWSMSEFLPVRAFEWAAEGELDEMNEAVKTQNYDFVKNMLNEAPRGAIFEVDMRYPRELHEQHNDYPLAPERLSIPFEWLSAKQLSLLVTHERENLIATGRNFIGPIKPRVPATEKLVPNLFDKERYTLHYRNLRQYIELGMEVTHVHRVLYFEQEAWLRRYIDFNTGERTRATNEFEKDLYKLLNNAVFGKTMENVREHRRLDLVWSAEKARKIAAKPTMRSFKRIQDNLLAIERYKTVVHLNKPIYVGLAVLDMSKTLMYDFHYNEVKRRYPGDQSRLCFTDTDSLLYSIHTRDIYADMLAERELYDWSGYPSNHPVFSSMDGSEVAQLRAMNKKKIGKMKDECDGYVMEEFVGIRSKCYSFCMFKGEQEDAFMSSKWRATRKNKGIKKSVVLKDLKHSDYRDCLLNDRSKNVTMYSLQSRNHRISLVAQVKRALTNYDDKRHILEDGITTLAHGHHRLVQTRR